MACMAMLAFLEYLYSNCERFTAKVNNKVKSM